MAFSITPGYDFAATEIPSQANFFKMISDMTLTGISKDMIDASIIGIKNEDSGVSLPSEGWMWIGPDGCLWAKSRWGNVRLYRGSWGGQETLRYMRGNYIRAPVSDPEYIWEPGFRLIYQGSTNNTEPSSVHLRNDWPINADRFLVKHLETAASGVHVRCTLWGYVPLPVSIHAHSFPGTLVYNTTSTFLVNPYPMTGTWHVKGLVFRTLATVSNSTMKWKLAYLPGMPHQQY